MPQEEKVHAVCVKVLGSVGLDEDTLQYIASGMVDDGSLLLKDEIIDFVEPLLQEHCDHDDDAKVGRLVRDLYIALVATLGSKGAPTAKQFETPLNFSAMKSDGSAAWDAFNVGGKGCRGYVAQEALKSSTGNGVSNAKARKVTKEIKANTVRRADQAQAEIDELDAAVKAAGEQAIQLMGSKDINYTQAIKIGPFDLPHPGGRGNLLHNVAMTLTPGRRYSLIGRNGTGKSTLLRNLAARRCGGIPEGFRLHYVSQDVKLSDGAEDLTPEQVVVGADVQRQILLKEEAKLQGCTTTEDNLRYREVLSELEAIDAAGAAIRATSMLVDLGVSEDLLGRPMKALSGGWRVRVALAAALFSRPDILFLDEPTNHLSMQAVLWLAHELTTSKVWAERIVCIVSHDRFFINETCTDQIHISGVARRLTQSSGTYSTWLRMREEQQRSFAHRTKVRNDEIAACKAYIASGQAAAGNTAASGRRAKIEKLEREAEEQAEELRALMEDKDLPLQLKSSGELRDPAVRLKNVAFAYPGGKPLFRGVGNQPHEFIVDTKARHVLMGENGNGKTTLMKLMLGALQPTDGEALINRAAKFALLNQHHADQLDLTMTPMEFMQSKIPGDKSESQIRQIRSELDKSGIGTAFQDVPAVALSGGQKSRLAMVGVSLAKPHVLFMDEPTNNLDVSAVEALADAVEQFDGGVVLVSHDKYFVSRVANTVWIVADGKVEPVSCGFEEYWAKMLCKINPESDLAHEALDAYVRKKKVSTNFLVGGQASRQALTKEKANLKAGRVVW